MRYLKSKLTRAKGNSVIVERGEDMETDEEPEYIPDDISEYSNSTSAGSERRGRRTAYSEKDVRIIREECKKIINSSLPIVSIDLKKLFTTNKRLIPLLKKFGFETLRIKVRTEKKNARKR